MMCELWKFILQFHFVGEVLSTSIEEESSLSSLRYISTGRYFIKCNVRLDSGAFLISTDLFERANQIVLCPRELPYMVSAGCIQIPANV